jgi:APA family basic amino acid/polyamine antiporter
VATTDTSTSPSATPNPTPSPQRGQLVRSLTLIPAASIVLANIIGTGVFIKARVMICNVGTPWIVLTVWLVAGLLSLAGAMAYAELAAMMPRAGGEYHFLGAAYGRLWAFLSTWTRAVGACASNAAVSIAFAIFLNDLLGGTLPHWAMSQIPIAILIVATALNLFSARSSGWTVTALTAIKVAMVAGIGISAFLLADGSWSHMTITANPTLGEGVPASARLGISGFGAAMLGALWGYNGWNVIVHIGGEVKDPSRNLPRALIGGAGLVIILYMLANAAYFYVLTPDEVASVSPHSSVAREVVVRFLGKGAAGVLAAGLMCSAYSTIHVQMLAVPRLPYAMAKDGLLPQWLTNVSRRGAPVPAVLMVGAISIALALSGTFDVLTDIYIFVLWIFYGLTCSSVFVLRRKLPDAPRPYRVWGYPIVPALFLLVTLFLLTNTLFATPGRSVAGLALIAAGLPIYAYYAPRAARSGQLPAEHD